MQPKRCDWVNGNELLTIYHDTEWGIEVHDEKKLFEMLVLEGMQAGLSWLTVLKKRENYREALNNFDYELIAKYTDKKINELLNNPGIIRNKLKINSIVTNARAFINVRKEFGSFDKYIWSFSDYKPIINSCKSMYDVPANTDLSDEISKDLKKRGFKFVGTTIIYAFIQAIGMVDDHIDQCNFKSKK